MNEIDHLTSGDVMTAVTFIIGIALSTWATLIAAALLFRGKSAHAKLVFEKSPGFSVFLGLIVGGAWFGVSLLFLGVPNPLVKLVGWGALSMFAAIMAIGGGGLALLVGSRIQNMETSGNGFWALARGAGFVVLPSMVPAFGWFAYTPIVMLSSFGAGLQAIIHRPAPSHVTIPGTGEAIH